MEDRQSDAPWHRQPGESEEAYEAFQQFLECRKVSGAARAVGKRRNLLTKWAKKHGWRERARQLDLHRARQDEVVTGEERDAALRRTAKHLMQVQELALARLLRIVDRDPETGEIRFDPKLTPQAAASVLRTATAILHQNEPPARDADESDDPDAELRRRTSVELRRLLEVIESTTDQEDSDAEPSTPSSP